MKKCWFSILLFVFLSITQASYAVTVFTNPMRFDENNFVLEGFDSLANNLYSNYSYALAHDATMSISGVIRTSTYAALSGTKYLDYGPSGGTIHITFSTPVRAVGFFLIAQGNSAYDRILDVTTSDGTVYHYGNTLYNYIPNTSGGEINGFVGFYDEAGITSMNWHWQSDAAIFDNVYYGNNLTELDDWPYQLYISKDYLPGLPAADTSQPWEYQAPEPEITVPEPVSVVLLSGSLLGVWLIKRK